ncbi:hypothetical protein [Treponema denticola]|uniref:hypothetical protein n=1 Tax=Treponema denticola TaxID=158 RepID=UPI002106903B|nr:hypothetical protein [Treponema denticola]
MIRGEIWRVDFGIPVGNLPAYRRPVNKYSFIEKISKINEDSYKKIVNAINTFIS